VQPGAETVIEGAPETPPGWTGGGARLVADEGSRLRLEVEMPADGYLVVADTWHPAWKATVDGQPAPVRPADLAFRAVPVPAGSHRVDMVYASPAFRLGAALSLAALAAWLGGWVWAARRPQPA
ncbi:MAG TPA: YfhO family protein, partial [Candidatus Nitrosotenuis sp.]|nr:YfhO family protein [Candidatus Nitrosotenuis sp.]